MIITLSGLPGAGKSTVKDMLAKRLSLKKYSMGDLRGKMAMDRGMTIDQLNELGMTESFTDKDADAFQAKLAEKEDNFVIDGRLSWHFIPQSIKVFLTVDPTEGAKRIFNARKSGTGRNDEPLYKSIEEARDTVHARFESDRARYQKWYGLDFLDLKNFDLVIDTTDKNPEETTQKILDFVAARNS